MLTLNEVVRAYIASGPAGAQPHQLRWWTERFGDVALTDVTEDMVDEAIASLIERGALKAKSGQPTERAHRPLSGGTINRYLKSLAQVYAFAPNLNDCPVGAPWGQAVGGGEPKALQ